MKVFVTGATGFVGKRLIRRLLLRGDQVVALTRSRHNMTGNESGDRLLVIEGDPAKPGDWQQQVTGCDAVVTLAGEPVFGERWSTAFKERLESSRIESAKQMCAAMAPLGPEARPRVWVAASAIGYYGARGDEGLTENAAPGEDFLARLCVRWEAESRAAENLGVRLVLLRIGIVLGDGGGMLAKMVPPFKAFVGGPLGGGRQFVSWIHLDDVIGLLELGLDRSTLSGPMNATAPQPVRMAELAKTLGEVLHRPSRLAVPELALRVAVGEASAVILASQRVQPERALGDGYAFKYPELRGALRSLLTK